MNTSSWAAVFALTTVLAAQGNVWIVDANNGPGTQFLDLPPAVANAADGDVLRVRPGSYSGVMITKAITVLGGAGVSLHVGTGFFEVANIGAGRQAAILVAGVGVQGPVQHLLFSVPVPNIPALLATVVTQQAVSATFAGGFKLSNPASYAHD